MPPKADWEKYDKPLDEKTQDKIKGSNLSREISNLTHVDSL
jgi:hypothetical protein